MVRRRLTTVVVVASTGLCGAVAIPLFGAVNGASSRAIGPPAHDSITFPGARGSYDVPTDALGGVSSDSYRVVLEADGIVVAEQQGRAAAEPCVVVATVSGAVTRGCWQGVLKPGTLVWAYDELDGSQAVVFATDGAPGTARVGDRGIQLPGQTAMAALRLRKGEQLPISVAGASTYTVSFPGGTAAR